MMFVFYQFFFILFLSAFSSENSKLSNYSVKECQDLNKTRIAFHSIKLSWLKTEIKKLKDPNSPNSFYDQQIVTIRSKNDQLMTIQDSEKINGDVDDKGASSIVSIKIDCSKNIIIFEFLGYESGHTQIYDLLNGKIIPVESEFANWSPDSNYLIGAQFYSYLKKPKEGPEGNTSFPVSVYDCRMRSSNTPCYEIFAVPYDSAIYDPIDNQSPIKWEKDNFTFPIIKHEDSSSNFDISTVQKVTCSIEKKRIHCELKKQISKNEKYLIWSPNKEFVISGQLYSDIIGSTSDHEEIKNFPVSIHRCNLNDLNSCSFLFQLDYESVIFNPSETKNLPIKNQLGIIWEKDFIKFQVVRFDKGNDPNQIINSKEIELVTCAKNKNLEFKCELEPISFKKTKQHP